MVERLWAVGRLLHSCGHPHCLGAPHMVCVALTPYLTYWQTKGGLTGSPFASLILSTEVWDRRFAQPEEGESPVPSSLLGHFGSMSTPQGLSNFPPNAQEEIQFEYQKEPSSATSTDTAVAKATRGSCACRAHFSTTKRLSWF